MKIEFLVYDADFIASALRSRADWLRRDSRPGCHDPEDCAKLERAADRLDAYADTIDEYLAALDRQGERQACECGAEADRALAATGKPLCMACYMALPPAPGSPPTT